MTLRIGTRGSALALAQAGALGDLITERTGIATELIPVTTHGDITRESLSNLGGTGVFASALREFLLAGECDLVVHSMKDLPTARYPGLTIGAVPPRADPRDTLCARDGLTLETLPQGARVGTGSPRRIAQLLSQRPDLDIRDIRGNVDTRLGFVADGELDAVVLAASGLARLGRSDAVTDHFTLARVPGAPAQGALAIEVRTASLSSATEDDLMTALAAIEDAPTHLAARAERAVLAQLEAGCAAPIGAYAEVVDGSLHLHAVVYSLDGTQSVSRANSARLAAGDELTVADTLGRALAEELLGAGAAEIAPLTA